MTLPESPIECIRSLLKHFLKYETLPAARALFGMIFCGRVEGKDLADTVLPSTPNLYRHAVIEFKIATNKQANADEAELYVTCLASIAKRKFALADLLSTCNKPQGEWLQDFTDDIWMLDQSMASHSCWTWMQNTIIHDKQQQHMFLVLCIFWLLKNADAIEHEFGSNLTNLPSRSVLTHTPALLIKNAQ